MHSVFEDAIFSLANSIDEESSNVKEVIDNSIDTIEIAIEDTLGTKSLQFYFRLYITST